MATETATVETLTAEVRVLMVGNRQITQTIAKQLDQVHPDYIDPFGRINAHWITDSVTTVIGRDKRDGSLVLSNAHTYGMNVTIYELADVTGSQVYDLDIPRKRGDIIDVSLGWDDYPRFIRIFGALNKGIRWMDETEPWQQRYRDAAKALWNARSDAGWADLPLVVLAGLR